MRWASVGRVTQNDRIWRRIQDQVKNIDAPRREDAKAERLKKYREKVRKVRALG